MATIIQKIKQYTGSNWENYDISVTADNVIIPDADKAFSLGQLYLFLKNFFADAHFVRRTTKGPGESTPAPSNNVVIWWDETTSTNSNEPQA